MKARKVKAKKKLPRNVVLRVVDLLRDPEAMHVLGGHGRNLVQNRDPRENIVVAVVTTTIV